MTVSHLDGPAAGSVSNAAGLMGIEHFAMPTRDIAGLESFVTQVLGGIPYYYAGFDDIDRGMGRKPHIFMRVGAVLFQCTEEGGDMHPRPDDPCVSPHWALAVGAGMLDALADRLHAEAIPFEGPISQPQYGGASIYFMSAEGHKLEACEKGYAGVAATTAESAVSWGKLAHHWAPSIPKPPLANINPRVGERFERGDNSAGLTGMSHFTLPVTDVARMRAFLTELLDARAFDGPSAPLWIGDTGFECTVDPHSPLYPDRQNDNISPHWSFGASAAALARYKEKLQEAGVIVAGPYLHRGIDLVSIYFKSPEGHKFEIGTWDAELPFPAAMMGAPEVGFIPWLKMDHDWRSAEGA